jgi:hypothetical protein
MLGASGDNCRQVTKTAGKRLSLSGLEVLHGRLFGIIDGNSCHRNSYRRASVQV